MRRRPHLRASTAAVSIVAGLSAAAVASTAFAAAATKPPFLVVGDHGTSICHTRPVRETLSGGYGYECNMSVEYGWSPVVGPPLPTHTTITMKTPSAIRIIKDASGVAVGSPRGTFTAHQWIWRSPAQFKGDWVILLPTFVSHLGMRPPFVKTRNCFTVTVTGDGVAPRTIEGCIVGIPS